MILVCAIAWEVVWCFRWNNTQFHCQALNLWVWWLFETKKTLQVKVWWHNVSKFDANQHWISELGAFGGKWASNIWVWCRNNIQPQALLLVKSDQHSISELKSLNIKATFNPKAQHFSKLLVAESLANPDSLTRPQTTVVSIKGEKTIRH